MLDSLVNKEFERVSYFHDDALHLSAIIAVHSTVLGPSLGGCRFKQYDSLDEAYFDVLRLAEGMSLKNAIAKLPLGGGKSVLIPHNIGSDGISTIPTDVRHKMFRRFGEWVNELSGSYIAAEDMGTSVSDVRSMAEVTAHVSGSDPNTGGGGDPSPYTAKGVYLSMKVGASKVFGVDSLKDLRVVVQGVGAVGQYLVHHLLEDGAKVIISDTSEDRLAALKNLSGVSVCKGEEVYSQDCDIFSPCAIGGILNDETVSSLGCKLIAGAANNQLANEDIERKLIDKDILYLPDFVINAGGVILCADEVSKDGFNLDRVESRVSAIPKTMLEIISESEKRNTLLGTMAVLLAKERIEAAK